MKKIAIIENEHYFFKDMFDAINFKYYQNKLTFEYFSKSQEIGDISKLLTFDLIIVDINLTTGSEKNGLAIIEELQLKTEIPPIIIFTAFSKLEEKAMKIKIPNLPIIVKPALFSDIYNVMKEYLPPSKVV